MDYVTQYYKNLAEQLQQRVDDLKNKIKYLEESSSPPSKSGNSPISGGGTPTPTLPGGGRPLTWPPPVTPIWGAPYGGWGGYGGLKPPSTPTGSGGLQGGNNFPEGYENNPEYLEWLQENPKPNPIYYPQEYQAWLASFWTWWNQTFN